MARINLLPWREQRRKQQQQDFLVAIGLAVAFTCVVLFAVYMHIEGMKEYQQQRNQRLQNEINVLNRKIKEIRDIEEKKNKLLTKIELIQKLQESRPEIVHLFDELPKVTPDGVYLTKFEQKGNNLFFSGKAQSNARVSALMRAIEHSPWMHSPKLQVIKGKGGRQEEMNDFNMTAIQGKKQAEQEGGKK